MSSTPDTTIDFVTTAPTAGDLTAVAWNNGGPRRGAAAEPPIQTFRHDEHTVILRQSKQVHYEAPFLFLLFGNDRALLLDTGATADPALFPLRATVDALIDEWLAAHPGTAAADYELVVAHTHGHGDHVAADGQFADRPHTRVVAREVEAVREFFGFDEAAWPTQDVEFDLGGRVLTLIAAPGHHKASVVFHDPWTGILFTGDTVLPARLYAFDFPAFVDTLDRLAAFAETHTVTHVFGCHVEMTDRPGRDYPLGARHQPAERRPEMTVAQLVAARDAARAAAGKKGVYRHDDFIIYNQPGVAVQLRMAARGLANRLRERVG